MIYVPYSEYACRQASTLACGSLIKINICADMLAELLLYRDDLTALEVENLESMYNKLVN